MTKIRIKAGQFPSILKKDLRLVFSKKTILVITLIPLLAMFLIGLLPIFLDRPVKMTINIYNVDAGSLESHVNGTVYPMNLGSDAVANIQDAFKDEPNIKIALVDSRAEALNSSYGVVFPENFTVETFNEEAVYEYRTSADPNSLEAPYFDRVLVRIQETIASAFLFLNLDGAIPIAQPVYYVIPQQESEGWQSATLAIAFPLAYVLFLLAAIAPGMTRMIGLSKDKEDGMLETLLTITKRHYHIILSKIITGFVAAMLMILSYFLGILLSNSVARLVVGEKTEDMFSLGISLKELSFGGGLALIFALLLFLALIINFMLAIELLLPTTVALGAGTLIMILFGNLFFFPIVFNPESTFILLHFNPLYWIYHPIMAMIDLSFGWVDAIYLVLFFGLFVGITALATRLISREKVLYT